MAGPDLTPLASSEGGARGLGQPPAEPKGLQRAEPYDDLGVVGSFRLVERIGGGGMGEVFLAFDQRLERWVALKHVTPEIAHNPRHRRRLKREARVAAMLNHPSIVQVYELWQDEEEVWIVMEYAPGPNLAQRLASGPFPLNTGLALARSIAEGISYAHRHGILHRDLKTENVILVQEDQAKIVDLGLSKRLRTGSIESEPTSTEAGQVIGTYRVMSPEQSRGLAVDERSDLFSLGVLFYELFTGKSPFLGADSIETITRVRTYRQISPRQWAGHLPESLSRLIDQLLEKNPARRPASAEEVVEILSRISSVPVVVAPLENAAALEATRMAGDVEADRSHPLAWACFAICLGFALIVILTQGRPWAAPAPIHVAIQPPRVGEGTAAEMDEVGEVAVAAVQAAIFEGLLSLDGVIAVTSSTPHLGTGKTVSSSALAVEEVIAQRLDCHQHTCRVTLERVLARDNSLRSLESFQVPADDLFLLSAAVEEKVRELFPRSPHRSAAFSQRQRSRRGADYSRLLQLKQAYLEQSQSPQEVLAALVEVRRRSPRLVEAYVTEGTLRHDLFFYSQDAEELKRALELFEEASRLAPDNPAVLLRYASVALESGRLEEARGILADLQRLEPGDARVLAHRARLRELEGDGEGALVEMRTAVQRWPAWFLRFDLALMEYRQGELSAASNTLERVLEIFPEHFRSQSFLAQLELFEGSPVRAEELYQALVERSAGPAELANLALAQMLQGRPEKAVANLRRASLQAPGNTVLLLNLADAEDLAGNRDVARGLYLKVAEAIDSSSAGWQELSVRAQAQVRLGQLQSAVAAMQQALRLSPNNPQLAYEAALVYNLAGERTSALVHAQRALSALDSRWFEFPWFDSLRESESFQALLSGPSQ
ncbi:MAG: protein kinase [Deltaproteobacteria bacterium]|nr:protein kinase [Deltaproteobacteria bacterium]